MKNSLLIAFALLLNVSFSQKIAEKESKIDFKIGSVMWSKVKGTIPEIHGTVKFDENNLTASSFDVYVNVKGINTDNEKRDDHLRNPDFFEVEKYPKMLFKSTQIVKEKEGYIAKGKLTVKDVSKAVEIPFIAVKTEGKTTLIGTLEIDRLDYNVGVDQSKILVDKKVKITITCVLL